MPRGSLGAYEVYYGDCETTWTGVSRKFRKSSKPNSFMNLSIASEQCFMSNLSFLIALRLLIIFLNLF